MEESTHKILSIGNVLSVILNLLVLMFFAGVTVALHGKFERTFIDLEIELTGMTRLFAQMPHSILFYPVLILAAVFLIAKEWLIKSPVIKFIINKLFFVFVFLVLVGYLVSMMMPLYASAQTL